MSLPHIYLGPIDYSAKRNMKVNVRSVALKTTHQFTQFSSHILALPYDDIVVVFLVDSTMFGKLCQIYMR